MTRVWETTFDECVEQVRNCSLAGTIDSLIHFRWHDCEPVCPHCGTLDIYWYSKPGKFKCKPCRRQFSLLSDTPFAYGKLELWKYDLMVHQLVPGIETVGPYRMAKAIDADVGNVAALYRKLGLPRKYE